MRLGILRQVLDDYLEALEALRGGSPGFVFGAAAAGLVLSWWLYVPVHELLHAYGCLWTGGRVDRLEIDAIYGARWLQAWFPFVHVGSDYAGQLTGFDPGGDDRVYLATVFAPFVLTVFPGVAMLRWVTQMRRPVGAAFTLGAAVPLAYAPLISLGGDFYEIGSIVVTRSLQALLPELELDRWRSDDVIALATSLPGGASAGDIAGIGVSFLLGCVLAVTTYGLGRMAASRIGIGR